MLFYLTFFIFILVIFSLMNNLMNFGIPLYKMVPFALFILIFMQIEILSVLALFIIIYLMIRYLAQNQQREVHSIYPMQRMTALWTALFVTLSIILLSDDILMFSIQLRKWILPLL